MEMAVPTVVCKRTDLFEVADPSQRRTLAKRSEAMTRIWDTLSETLRVEKLAEQTASTTSDTSVQEELRLLQILVLFYT